MPLKSPFKKSGPKPASKPSSSSKGKVVAKTPAKGAQKKPPIIPASRPAGAKPTTARRTAAPPPPPPPLFNLSDERKLDVLGVVLALSGVLMLLALISANPDTLIGAILDVFSVLFGWGTFILPVVLILFGGWLVLRKIERI